MTTFLLPCDGVCVGGTGRATGIRLGSRLGPTVPPASLSSLPPFPRSLSPLISLSLFHVFSLPFFPPSLPPPFSVYLNLSLSLKWCLERSVISDDFDLRCTRRARRQSERKEIKVRKRDGTKEGREGGGGKRKRKKQTVKGIE